ncbi:EAL domain-containing protein [Aliivibrio kagoshimensis]|uniref:EAL domain-containing protein n=1 Tax=Aliivibrio kagoshimensis TaxID=2910230 RepID=UPI003D0AB047
MKQLHTYSMELKEETKGTATHDLPNRSDLIQRAHHLLDDEHIVTFKITNLSVINERFGYDNGDQLLNKFSQFLQSESITKLSNAECYRMGVGIWAIVFSSNLMSKQLLKRCTDLAELAENVSEQLYDASIVAAICLDISGGLISQRDFRQCSGDQIVVKLVMARRLAVNSKRYICNAQELLVEEKSRQDKLHWMSIARHAILDNHVEPYFQPIVHACSHRLHGYESLMRISNREGVYSPSRFLTSVEGTLLYNKLSRKMIQRTFDVMKDRQEHFSINLTYQDFVDDQTVRLLETVLSHINDLSRVSFEIVETDQIHDFKRIIDMCEHYRRLGVSIVIDDFGVGYSDIYRIIQLKPDTIKLDGSLIKYLDIDKRQRKITKQIIKLCHVFEAKTVAEYVHNNEVCRIAEDFGIDYLQGYYFSEPVGFHQLSA